MEDAARLADMPAGPVLAAALARIDPAHVPNNHLLTVLVAQHRQANHEAARLLGVIAEINRAVPTFDDGVVDRLDHAVPHAADEVRAALAWSRRAADREGDLAEQLVHDLPAVYAAFLAGHLDRSKVRVFADHLAGLTDAQITTVCEMLLPVAGRLTPGQLVARLRRLVAAIDPRHYERRYRKALRDRTLCAWLDENGTAVLHARGLTHAQAQAAVERIDLLAHAARRAGHPSTLDQIRVDLLAGLLDGTLHHLHRDQILAHLLTHRSGNDDPTPTSPADHADDRDAAAGDDRAGDGTAGDDRAGDGTAGDDRAGDDRAVGHDQRVGVEVRVALSTLVGHDDHPGEIPGLGPIPTAHARTVVVEQRRAEWRYAITDPDGRLLFDGLTRRRPTGPTPTGARGGIVELHIPATLLTELTSGDTPAEPAVERWAAVLADIAHQYNDRDKRDLDAHPDDRLPRAALRRHTQIRDRTCVGIGCRHRPVRCDQDHTIEHQHGGTTVAADLGPLCRHDHLLKQQGWTLQQPEPGTFLWLSPLGGRYQVEPEPVLPPLPDPHPGPDDHAHDDPAPPGPDTLMMYGPDPPPSPAVDEPEPVDLDTPPPFLLNDLQFGRIVDRHSTMSGCAVRTRLPSIPGARARGTDRRGLSADESVQPTRSHRRRPSRRNHVTQLLKVQNFTVSRDGFGAGENQTLERPFGHADPATMMAWAGATASWPNRTDPGGSRGLDDYFTRDFAHNIGAEIMGRNKFGPQRGPWHDHDWLGWWGDEPPFHTPVFVLTHHTRPSFTLSDTTFHFVDGDPATVLDRAREAAQGKDVRLGGGATTIREFLDADLVDTLHVVVSPVELGSGVRLWESPDELDDRFHHEVAPSPSGVTHHLFWRK